MIVNEKKKYICIHIPKTGGESLHQVLIADGGKVVGEKHSTYRDAIEHFTNGDIAKYFFFSFVRNPWEQAVSFYEHLRKPAYMDHALLKAQYSHFDGYVGPKPASKLACETDFATWCKKIYGQRKFLHRYFLDQTFYLTDYTGNLAMDFVGRFENLEKDFEHISSELKISGSLPHKNKSKREGYRHYYDELTEAVVRDNFERTIAQFGYEF